MSLNDFHWEVCMYDDPCDDCSHWFHAPIVDENLELLLDDPWNSWAYYH